MSNPSNNNSTPDRSEGAGSEPSLARRSVWPAVTGVTDKRFPRCNTRISASAGRSRIPANLFTRVLHSACTSTSSQRGASGFDLPS